MTNAEGSTELEFKKIQLETAATELRLKQAELRQKERTSEPRGWLVTGTRNQAILATLITALIALLGTLGASAVTYLNAHLQLQADVKNKEAQLALERDKAYSQRELNEMRHEASLITNAVQQGGGNPITTAQNLCFLLQAGLLPRAHTQFKIGVYLENILDRQRCRPPGG